MSKEDHIYLKKKSNSEVNTEDQLKNLFNNSPIADDEKLSNVGVFMNRQVLSRILFFNEIYQKILHIPGSIFEFGVRWGQDLVTLQNLRGIFEPYNYTRKIVGFDTFSGFPSVHEKDNTDKVIQVGAYSVAEGYENFLEELLKVQEEGSPLNHIKKHELVKGDAIKSIDEYLKNHSETIIAFAYFDFDLYEPTKICLEKIKPYLVKGSIVGFDELNHPEFPGETVAFREALDGLNYSIHRQPWNPYPSYIIIE